MYELIQVSDSTCYVQSPAKIGLVKLNDKDVCLIDSGNDKEAGRKVRQILDANGWSLKAIYNTHSHADHIGGNQYLQAQTGCKVYAKGVECDYVNHPILEPVSLYAGCPPKELRHKFLMAQPSTAEPLTDGVLPEGFSIIPLPGHSMDMVGYRTADDVVFLADCLSSQATLEKYGIPFIHDVGAYISTLEAVEKMEARMFIPAHADPAEDISGLARLNIDRAVEIGDEILGICSEASSFEDVLRKLFVRYGLTMTLEQYVLVGSTVRSYLAWMMDAGKLTVEIRDGLPAWKSA